MATNIPPHNLGEVVDAVIHFLDNPESTPKDLMRFIKGPDFPTGAHILGKQGIQDAYLTGRGSIKVRAVATVEENNQGRQRIVVTELPYQVNKARLAEKIAELVRAGKLKDIADLKDESNRHGMRLVIDLKRAANPQVVLNQLYKHTQLQENFGVIMLALVDNVPRVLNLAEMIGYYVDHQVDVVTRRTQYELRRAEERDHIVQGLLIALQHLDEVIRIIRGAADSEDARTKLMKKFKLSEIQANHILDMPLRRLTKLARAELEQEHRDLLARIKYLKALLKDPKKIRGVIKEELLEVRKKHADARRTQLRPDEGELDIEDLIAEEDVVISITHTGYIKRTSISTYRSQKRGGRGRMGMRTKDEDFVDQLFIASTHSYILIFTDRGRVYWLKVHEIPEVGPQGRGKAVVNLVHLTPQEKIAAFISVKAFDPGRYVLLATRKGIVKKTEISNFANPRTAGIIALGVEDDDALIEAVLTAGKDEVLLGTKEGMAIHFAEEDVRPMGRAAYGVKGIELEKDDDVVGVEVVSAGGTVLTLTSNGYGKRTTIDEYRLQSRGGKGIIDIKTTERNGPVVGVKFLRGDEQVMLITEKGMIIRLNTAEISTIGRNTQGVRLIQLEEGDHLVSVARLAEREEGDEGGPPRPDVPPEGKEEA
jgi:DNA gyrase subunit A